MTDNIKKLAVSCFIIAKNEEDRIAKTINSVIDIVDEVIVIDSGSTDKTEDICNNLGVKFLHNAWPGYGPQKRFGEEQCTYDWVLNLDADEVPTSDLRDEISTLLKEGEPQYPGYSIYFPTVYPGDRKPRLFADYHNYIRLYDRTKIRFSESPVHDTVRPGNHKIGQLKAPAYHHSIHSLSHQINKYNSYTDLQARTLKKQNLFLLKLRLLVEFPFGFIKIYVLRRHFTGGFKGMTYALTGAAFRHFRIAKILEEAEKRAAPERFD